MQTTLAFIRHYKMQTIAAFETRLRQKDVVGRKCVSSIGAEESPKLGF